MVHAAFFRTKPSRRYPNWACRSIRVTFIILKAREYDMKEPTAIRLYVEEGGSNATVDGQTDVLVDKADDPGTGGVAGRHRWPARRPEFRLVALAWLGADTYAWMNEEERWRQRGASTMRGRHVSAGLLLWAITSKTAWPCSTNSVVDQDDKREGLDARTSRWTICATVHRVS